MKKTLLSLIPAIALVLTLGLFTHTVSAQERQAPKAVWTLDGKTLNDFECFLDGGVKKEDVFKLEDGILKVGGTPFGWLAPKDLKLRNFVLTAEICYPTDDPNVNSGFFLRMTDGEDRPTPAFLPPCIECQLQTQNMGHLFGFHGHTLIGAAERYDYRPRSVDGEKVRAELHRVKNVKNAQKPGKEGALVLSAADKGASTQRWTVDEADYVLSGDNELDLGIAKILSNHTTLRSCFNYVVGFKYRSGNKYGKRVLGDEVTKAMAKEMIARHSGNCYRFAALFSWLARGLGYDTTVRAGYVPSASGGRAPHGWVEVHMGGRTYLCDPDLAHEIPGHKWYMTTYGGAPVWYSR